MRALTGDQATGNEPVGLLVTDFYSEIHTLVNTPC